MSRIDHAEGVGGDRQASSDLHIHLDSLYDKVKYEELRAELAAAAEVVRQIVADFNNLGDAHSRRGKG